MRRPFFLQKLDEIRYADWISVRKTILVFMFLAVALFILLNLGYIGMLWSTRKMDGIADGRILSRNDQVGIIESKNGNRTEALSTKYEYEYYINGNLYYGTCFLTFSPWNMKKLNMIKTNPLPIKIVVKYDKKQPYISTIWLP